MHANDNVIWSFESFFAFLKSRETIVFRILHLSSPHLSFFSSFSPVDEESPASEPCTSFPGWLTWKVACKVNWEMKLIE